MKALLILIIPGTILLASLALAQEPNASANYLQKRSSASTLPPNYINNNVEIIKYCTGCHSINRINSGLKDWFMLSEPEYNDAVSSMITKKVRMLEGKLPRKDGQAIKTFLLNLYAANSQWSP